MQIAAYMTARAYGNYSHAARQTREAMETAALLHAAQEQTRPTIYATAGAAQALGRYAADAATARDIMTLQSIGALTTTQADEYRSRHGWTPRKFPRR